LLINGLSPAVVCLGAPRSTLSLDEAVAIDCDCDLVQAPTQGGGQLV
jgi:hypothetical protein